MTDGWMLLEPSRRWVASPQLSIKSDGGLLNAAARRAIGINAGGKIELAVRTNGEVSIRAARPGVSPTVTVRPHGSFPALHLWARAHGYEFGEYGLEERDGALYCRLRKAMTNGSE